MSFRKILCPIDFSPGSNHALRLAAALAKASQCELVIAHAWFVPLVAYSVVEWMMPPDVVQAMVDDDKTGLAAAAATAKELGVDRVTPVLHVGQPAEQILRMLHDDYAFDLVVVGTHGRTGLQRVLLGSVSEAVVRHSPCSVLAAREGKEAATFRKILCPTDFSESAAAATDRAVELVDPAGGSIMLLHAVEVPVAYSRDFVFGNAEAELDRLATHALDQALDKLRRRVQVPVTARAAHGRAGREILDALDREPFDLVVMGSHGRTGLRRIVLGSVAEKVVRHAPCPVLVSRTRAA